MQGEDNLFLGVAAKVESIAILNDILHKQQDVFDIQASKIENSDGKNVANVYLSIKNRYPFRLALGLWVQTELNQTPTAGIKINVDSSYGLSYATLIFYSNKIKKSYSNFYLDPLNVGTPLSRLLQQEALISTFPIFESSQK